MKRPTYALVDSRAGQQTGSKHLKSLNHAESNREKPEGRYE